MGLVHKGLKYDVAFLDIPEDTALPLRAAGAPSARLRGVPYSYPSIVDGRPVRHDTWAECERRVKGARARTSRRR